VLYYCGVINRFFLQTVTYCGLRSRPYGDKRHVSIGQHLSKTGRSSTVACLGTHWSITGQWSTFRVSTRICVMTVMYYNNGRRLLTRLAQTRSRVRNNVREKIANANQSKQSVTGERESTWPSSSCPRPD